MPASLTSLKRRQKLAEELHFMRNLLLLLLQLDSPLQMIVLLFAACLSNSFLVAQSETSDIKCFNDSRLSPQLEASEQLELDLTGQQELCPRQNDKPNTGGNFNMNVTTLSANRTNPPQMENTISPQLENTVSPQLKNTVSPQSDELDLTQSEMVTEMSTSARVGTTTSYLLPFESCKGKCGNIMGIECSCDLKCLVHKNCCEDMETACPEVLEESRLRYGHMLDMKVECSHENIFVITQCGRTPQAAMSPQVGSDRSVAEKTLPLGSEPKAFPKPENGLEHSKTFAAKKNFTSADQTHNTNSANVRHYLANPYVTDVATGFVYKNMDIYSCAARNNSRPVKWDGGLFSKTSYDKTNLGSILRALCKENMVYIPPDGMQTNLTGARCIFGVRDCSDETRRKNASFLSQCQRFISYQEDDNKVVYQNRYCALCENVRIKEYGSYITPMIDLEIRINMTESNKSIRIMRKDTGNGYGAWLEAKCNSSDETENNDLCSQEAPCEVEQCMPNTFKRPDGNCKFLHYLTLAVSDDDYPLSQDEITAFPEFVRCFVKLYVGLDIDDDLIPTEIMFDERVNGNLYVTKLYVYETRFHLSELFSNPDDTAQIKRLFLMSKSFKNYRRSQVNESSARTVASTSRTIYSHDFRHYLHTNQERLNGTVDVTVTCMCFILNIYPIRLDTLYCPLACAEDPMFVGDQEAVTAYLTSTCFSAFDKNGNDGCLMTMSGPALTIFLVFVHFL